MECLRSPEWRFLKECLREFRDQQLDTCAKGSDPLTIYRAQGKCELLEEILNDAFDKHCQKRLADRLAEQG